MAKGDKPGGGGRATTERPQAAVAPAEAALDLGENFDAGDVWGVANYQEWWDSLTAAEQKMIRDYQEDIYIDVNNFLRSGETGYLSSMELRGKVSLLDEALRKGRLGRDLMVYRGVYDPKEVYGHSPMDLVGKSIHDKGYTSSSLSRVVAQSSFGSSPELSVTFRIRVPKGSQGGYLGSLGNPTTVGEREFLLPRGQKYRVTKVTKTSKGYVADAEVY